MVKVKYIGTISFEYEAEGNDQYLFDDIRKSTFQLLNGAVKECIEDYLLSDLAASDNTKISVNQLFLDIREINGDVNNE